MIIIINVTLRGYAKHSAFPARPPCPDTSCQPCCTTPTICFQLSDHPKCGLKKDRPPSVEELQGATEEDQHWWGDPCLINLSLSTKDICKESIWKVFTCWGGVDDSKIFWLEISKMVLHWRIKKKTILISLLTLIIIMIITIITISWPLTFSAVSTKTFLAKLRTASTFVSVISSTLSKKSRLRHEKYKWLTKLQYRKQTLAKRTLWNSSRSKPVIPIYLENRF